MKNCGNWANSFRINWKTRILRRLQKIEAISAIYDLKIDSIFINDNPKDR